MCSVYDLNKYRLLKPHLDALRNKDSIEVTAKSAHSEFYKNIAPEIAKLLSKYISDDEAVSNVVDKLSDALIELLVDHRDSETSDFARLLLKEIEN